MVTSRRLEARSCSGISTRECGRRQDQIQEHFLLSHCGVCLFPYIVTSCARQHRCLRAQGLPRSQRYIQAGSIESIRGRTLAVLWQEVARPRGRHGKPACTGQGFYTVLLHGRLRNVTETRIRYPRRLDRRDQHGATRSGDHVVVYRAAPPVLLA